MKLRLEHFLAGLLSLSEPLGYGREPFFRAPIVAITLSQSDVIRAN